jgi:hypothetical protein
MTMVVNGCLGCQWFLLSTNIGSTSINSVP